GEAYTLYYLGSAYSALRESQKALDHYQQALSIFRAISDRDSEAFVIRGVGAAYFASNKDAYDFYIDLLILMHERQPSAGYDVAALLASERARARSLLESLAEAQANIRQGIDPALLKRERGLQQQINAKAEHLTRLLSGKH